MAMQVGSYEMRGKPLVLLRRFEAAQGSDKEAEARAKKLGTWAVVCGVGAFLSIFLAAFVGLGLLDTGLLFVLPPVLLGAAIVLGVEYARAKRFDLDDRKLGAVVRVLRMLRTDTPLQSDVELKVDFRDYAKGGEKLEEQKSGTFGSVKTKKYEHEWFRFGGVLADGTRYQLSAGEAIGRKEKRKRKYTKVKERIAGRVAIQLRLRPGKYGETEAVAATLRGLAPPRPLALKAVTARGQRLRIALETPPCVRVKGRYGTNTTAEGNLVTGDALLQAMLWAYDGIGRSLAKSA